MGKKGGWISALKRAFTLKSKEKFDIGQDIYVQEKKKHEKGRKIHGEVNSFIPLYREPSSIEKILGDVDKEQQYKAHQVSYKQVQQQNFPIIRPNTSANTLKNAVSAKADSSDRKTTVALLKAKSIIPSKQAIIHNRKYVTSNYVHISATKIQAAYKGYMARKSYKAIKGLLRLKNMMNGQSVIRQTMNTMRSMQLLVRIQTQIHARRLQLMENQNIQQNQTSWKSNKENVSSLSMWSTSNQLGRESYDEWDDSMLTKEERDANVKRKVEAVMKRERALAYAYSHELLTITPKTSHPALADAPSGKVPVWWNWLKHHKIPATPPTPRPSSAAHHRPGGRSKPPKTPPDGYTPRLSRPLHTHISSNRWQATQGRPALRDDESLTSCPGFTESRSSAAAVPNYMAPTVFSKAKVRSAAIENHGGKEGRRFSFALNQSFGSLRLFSVKKKEAPAVAPAVAPAKEKGRRHRTTPSVGELSVDSTVSLPVGLGRRHFK